MYLWLTVAVAVALPTSASAGPIMKTAARLAAEMTPAQVEFVQTPASPRAGVAPTITKRSSLRTFIGVGLKVAAVYIPDDWPARRKDATQSALLIAGAVTTLFFTQTPDHNKMAAAHTAAIASCVDVNGPSVIVETVDPNAARGACPAALDPPTAKATGIATATIQEVFESVYGITQRERERESRWHGSLRR